MCFRVNFPMVGGSQGIWNLMVEVLEIWVEEGS